MAGGLQVKRWRADLIALLVIGWSAADAYFEVATSPMTWIGSIATAPLQLQWYALLGPATVVVAVVVGANVINRLSIESAERRSRLIGQLRFAATLQDVRTVMVIQRQLSQEHTRVKPWVHMRPATRVGLRNGRVSILVYIRRTVAGLLRWPLVRFVRVFLFVGVAVACIVGVWGGTIALVIPAGIALWLAGLDLVEALAQEIDHPDRAESLPRSEGTVLQAQLVVPFFVLFGVELFYYFLLGSLATPTLSASSVRLSLSLLYVPSAGPHTP